MDTIAKKGIGAPYKGPKGYKPENLSVAEAGDVTLTRFEIEAIRLADIFGLKYKDAGREMGVSTATFGRTVRNARKKIADALVNSKAIFMKDKK